MTEKDLIERTRVFANRVVRLCSSLPRNIAGNNIGNQLFRCGTSVASNYRAACRGRSKAEFLSKLGIVEEEADESAFWLEIIIDQQLIAPQKVRSLLDEANQITRIISASRITARKNQSKLI